MRQRQENCTVDSRVDDAKERGETLRRRPWCHTDIGGGGISRRARTEAQQQQRRRGGEQSAAPDGGPSRDGASAHSAYYSA